MDWRYRWIPDVIDMFLMQENVMKQDNVSAGQTRELDNPQLICEWLGSHFHVNKVPKSALLHEPCRLRCLAPLL